MESDLSKLLKFIALLFLINYMGLAHAADESEDAPQTEDKDATSEENALIMLREQGNVEGYVSLTVSEQPIDATYMPESLGIAAGKVLILPGRGQDIDSGIIHTLRRGLSKAGWSTMTVSMHYELTPNIYLASTDDEQSATDSTETPQQAADAEQAPEETEAEASDAINPPTDSVETTSPSTEGQLEEDNEEKEEQQQSPYVVTNEARIAAAMNYLAEKQPGPTALIGFGEASEWVNESVSMANGEVAVIWINADMPLGDPPKVKAILDLISDRPFQTKATAVQRRVSMKKANANNYEQREIVATNPNFYGVESNVLGIVRGWLHKHFIAKDDD